MNEKAKVLDIAMNLYRIGNWTADDFDNKKARIQLFLDQTTKYIDSLNSEALGDSFQPTLDIFLPVYQKMRRELKEGSKDRLYLAEQLMTWGNILTHRASLIVSS